MLLDILIVITWGLALVLMYKTGKNRGYQDGYYDGQTDAYTDAADAVKNFKFKR